MKRLVVGLVMLGFLVCTVAPAAAEVEQVIIKVSGALNCVF